MNKKYEVAEINELLEKLLESRRQIDAVWVQLKTMEKQLETARFNILRVMNRLAGKLFEEEASE